MKRSSRDLCRRKNRPAVACESLSVKWLVRCLVLCAAVALGGRSDLALAQDRVAYEVTGFRNAHFGMTEPELRATITREFLLRPADIVSSANPVEGTTVLTTKVASLEPGPGPAVIAYIFGHSSKRLIQVNVIWSDEAKAAGDANAMIAAGERLQRYFAGYSWKKETTRSGIPVGPNTIVLFSGEDGKSGAVRLVLDGVKYQVQRDGKEQSSPDPKGPPRVLINYIANRDNPDVATIPKGQF